MDEDLKITKSDLTRFGTFKLNLYWSFYDEIQWFKTLFTFRNKEQRETWKAEMEEAKTAPRLRVTEETTWGTPRIAMVRSEEYQGEAAFAMLKSLFKSTFSPRAYFKDMFSGWNIGWEKRAEAIYRGDV